MLQTIWQKKFNKLSAKLNSYSRQNTNTIKDGLNHFNVFDEDAPDNDFLGQNTPIIKVDRTNVYKVQVPCKDVYFDSTIKVKYFSGTLDATRKAINGIINRREVVTIVYDVTYAGKLIKPQTGTVYTRGDDHRPMIKTNNGYQEILTQYILKIISPNGYSLYTKKNYTPPNTHIKRSYQTNGTFSKTIFELYIGGHLLGKYKTKSQAEQIGELFS